MIVTILAASTKAGKTKEGKDYSMVQCQCFVRGDINRVGELILPKGSAEPAPGDYEVIYQPTVNFEGKVVAQVKELRNVRETAKPKAAA